MKNVLGSILIATVAISAPALASGGFNEQNLTFVVDARSSDMVLCLDNFCDTVVCALDADNVHTCLWNSNCAGTDNQDMIGFKVGPTLTIGGEVNSAAATWGWRIDAPGRSMELFGFLGVGQSALQATDTFSLNTCDFAAPRPGQSILESLEQ